MKKDVLSYAREGMSQSERQLDELVPEHLQLDERDIPDLLTFMTELAGVFNYYNSDNTPDGDWTDFFTADVNILVVLICKFDLSKNLNRYDTFLASVNYSEEESKQLSALQDLFRFFYDIVSQLSTLHRRFQEAHNYSEIKEILEVITSFHDEIYKLRMYNEEAQRLFGDKVKIDFDDAMKGGTFAQTGTVDYIFTEGKDAKERIQSAIPAITRLFNDLRAKYNHLLELSEYYLKKNKLLDKTYHPHIGLVMAFLELYQHLRKKFNGLTRRHLDFYYRQVLGIHADPARPDKVHVLFEPDPAVHSLILGTHQKLQAEIPGREEPVLYRLEGEETITQAKIAEIKTLFMSDYLQIVAESHENTDVRETQVYKAAYPVFEPGVYLKKPDDFRSWPVLGEDQHDLSETQRTMLDTDIGLVIGSPMFYQTEGDRTVTLRITFDDHSFESLRYYMSNFSEVTGKNQTVVLFELLSTAFVLDYTTDEGWQNAGQYTVRLNMDPGENYLELGFDVHAEQEAMGLYKEKIHQNGFDAAFPLVRILLNNNSSHHAYSFLNSLMIERIGIRVDVKGYANFKLQNNVGPLSPAAPYQVFGPQPNVGAYIDIKNTNIFNRYTKDFTLHVEWLDLPRDPGGFTAYYQAYNTGITNESYQVGLSALQQGSFRPEETLQQRFPLFEVARDKQSLKQKSTIENVDFKRIEFLNDPQMAEEDIVSESGFKEGAVRLQLLSPSDAFGHRLYPKIFPEIIMHNARKLVRKKPLPNQPYIPMVKSITADVVLEHSENFKDNKGNTSENDILLIHQHPFGFETIYPRNDKKHYYFIPQYQEASNLLLGFENMQPNQQVSLLFELEEKNFHHTLHEPQVVKWSYLSDNTWTPLNDRDVLYDSTNNFINSGIVKIRVPADLSGDNTILNPGLFWLRAAVRESTDVQSRAIAIHANAVEAVRVANTGEARETQFDLPSNSIKAFSRNVKGIQNIWQLFPSFGGKAHESAAHYYVRVSERLRHKQRPVLARDIMEAILQEFPQILMAKCFSTEEQQHQVLPGVNIQVVVIPKEREDGRFISEEPKVNLATLFQVKNFISRLISPFIKIEVGNPIYEKIKVICKVTFTDTRTSDYGFYIRRLNEDVNRYIAPWLYGGQADLKIGSRIYKSDILLFIKTRPYVAYVTGFSVIHFYNLKGEYEEEFKAEVEDSAAEDLEYIMGSTPGAVLIPSSHHHIEVIAKPAYEEPQRSGINNMIVGEEFLITNKYDPDHVKKTVVPDPEPEDDVFTLIITHKLD